MGRLSDLVWTIVYMELRTLKSVPMSDSRDARDGMQPVSLDLQAAVDELSARLERSVALDNQFIEVIATSAHSGAIDQARSDAILGRRTPTSVVRFVRSLKLESAYGIVEVPRNEELQTLARLCVPLRQGAQVVGYLWVFDDPELTAAQRKRFLDASQRITEILGRTLLDSQRQASRASSYLEEAIATDSLSVADAAAAALLEPSGEASVLSLTFTARDRRPRDEQLNTVLVDYARTAGTVRSLTTIFGDGILAVGRSRWPQTGVPGVAGAFQRSAERSNLTLHAVGVSELSSPRVRQSAQQADLANRVARTRNEGAPVHFETLGAWQVLADVEPSLERVVKICPQLAPLIGYSRSPLIETLTAYYELGRDVQAVCAALSIKRATLYYRLDKAQMLMGSAQLPSPAAAIDIHTALRLYSLLQVQDRSQESRTHDPDFMTA